MFNQLSCRSFSGLCAVVGVAVTVSACGRTTPTSPMPPIPPSAPAATYTVSGVVSTASETGRRPVEGIVVRDASSAQRATTDRNGFYSLPGLHARATSIVVEGYGYVAVTRTLTISGDTQLDIEVVRFSFFTLSGVVFEEAEDGRVAVEGVQVYCDACGEHGHTSSYTDAQGVYGFPEVSAGNTVLLVWKAGYTVVGGTPLAHFDMRNVSVQENTRFDIQLVRR